VYVYKKYLSVILTFCSLISTSDSVSISELTLILKIIGQCDVKQIMILPIKTMTSVLKVSTYILLISHPGY